MTYCLLRWVGTWLKQSCWMRWRSARSTTLTELTERQRRVPEAVFFAGGRFAAVHGVAEIAVEHDGVSVGVRVPVPAQHLPVLHARILTVNHCVRETPPLRKSAVRLKRGDEGIKNILVA